MVQVKNLPLFLLFAMCLALMVGAPAKASDLTDALKKRDVALVRSLIAAGADTNEKVRGDYPLNIAATFGPVEMVAALIDAGSHIENIGREGYSPLHNAVIMGQKETVAFLLQKGAVVDAKDKLGRTPLCNFAARAGSDIEIPKILLAAGAGPDIESAAIDESPTPLHYAAETANLELVQLLLAAKADINHQNTRGWTPFHQAVYNSRLEIVRLFIAQGADVNLMTKLRQTPLSMAQTDAMRQLLIASGAK